MEAMSVCTLSASCSQATSPTQASSMFDSTSAFLSTPFSLFGGESSAVGGGGDASSNKHMLGTPEKGDANSNEGTSSFDLGGSMAQGKY